MINDTIQQLFDGKSNSRGIYNHSKATQVHIYSLVQMGKSQGGHIFEKLNSLSFP